MNLDPFRYDQSERGFEMDCADVYRARSTVGIKRFV